MSWPGAMCAGVGDWLLGAYESRVGASTASGSNVSGARRGSSELLRAEYPEHAWAIDLQFDQMTDGGRLKLLIIIDEYSRMRLAICVDRRCKAVNVIDSNEEHLKQYPAPTHLRMDNGPKLIVHALQE